MENVPETLQAFEREAECNAWLRANDRVVFPWLAATCGAGLNNAMASAVNVLGDVHGGAGEQAVGMYLYIAARQDAGASLADAVRAGLDAAMAEHGKFVSGFGHRFHPVDPRAAPLLALVDGGLPVLSVPRSAVHELSKTGRG